jgi:hypothetical protein
MLRTHYQSSQDSSISIETGLQGVAIKWEDWCEKTSLFGKPYKLISIPFKVLSSQSI